MIVGVDLPMRAHDEVGALAPVASSILLEILYGARMARLDLLRAVC